MIEGEPVVEPVVEMEAEEIERKRRGFREEVPTTEEEEMAVEKENEEVGEQEEVVVRKRRGPRRW